MAAAARGILNAANVLIATITIHRNVSAVRARKGAIGVELGKEEEAKLAT